MSSGSRNGRDSTAREALLEYLRDRQALLLLDNFEHVLAAAPLVRELLAGAPGVKVLVTSRAPLDVPEERVYRVPALELPDPSRRPSLARLRRTEAIRLFVDRARAARPDFELSETNAESVVELCVRLDGLPLALELAAARCNLLSPRALLERLDSRLDLLRAAPGSGVTERQWTLRGGDRVELRAPGAGRAAALHEPRASSSAGSRWAPPSSSPSSPTSTSWRRRVAPPEQPAHDRARTRRRASPGDARDHPRVRARASGGARRRRGRPASARRLLPRAGRGGRAGPARPAAARVARASRRRAGQHPRCAHAGRCDAGEAEIGLRIGSALWRFWQLRNHEQEGRERLEELLALGSGSPRHPREGANDDRRRWRSFSATSRRRDAMLEESLPVHRRDRRRAHGREHARASRLVSLRRGHGYGPRPEPGRPSRWLAGEPIRTWSRHASGKSASALAARGELEDAERTHRGGGRPGTEARRCPERRLVAEVARRASRSCAAITHRRAAAVRREPGHPPKPGRRMGRLALSLQPRLPRARGGRRRDGARRCSPRRSRSNARAAISRGSRTRSRCRRGSPQRTGSRRSPFGCMPAPRCSASACAACTFEVGWPDPDAEPRRPPLAGGRGDVRGGVGAGRAMTLLEAIDQAIAEEHELEPDA